MLRLVPGEIQIDRMDMVEDTKGNNGDRGDYQYVFLLVVNYAEDPLRCDACDELATDLVCQFNATDKPIYWIQQHHRATK